MPHWLTLILAMAATCALVVIITKVVRRRGVDTDPSETPDVIEYMTMMIGVVYAIVLGLAIAGVWEARGEADATVRTEAQALHEVSERAQVFPEPVRDKVDRSIEAYARYVVDEEWPRMAEHGQLTERGDQLLDAVRVAVRESEPRNELQGQAYAPMVDQVALADEARTNRGDAAEPAMPPVVWFGLIAGALVSVGMIFALQIRYTRRELTVAGLYTALFVFLLILIWDMDAPFSRGMPITADPFTGQLTAGG
ncbi:bestrophin-like domain [Streptomyces sp. O3]